MEGRELQEGCLLGLLGEVFKTVKCAADHHTVRVKFAASNALRSSFTAPMLHVMQMSRQRETYYNAAFADAINGIYTMFVWLLQLHDSCNIWQHKSVLHN